MACAMPQSLWLELPYLSKVENPTPRPGTRHFSRQPSKYLYIPYKHRFPSQNHITRVDMEDFSPRCIGINSTDLRVVFSLRNNRRTTAARRRIKSSEGGNPPGRLSSGRLNSIQGARRHLWTRVGLVVLNTIHKGRCSGSLNPKTPLPHTLTLPEPLALPQRFVPL